jgi:hypothetical protein
MPNLEIKTIIAVDGRETIVHYDTLFGVSGWTPQSVVTVRVERMRPLAEDQLPPHQQSDPR